MSPDRLSSSPSVALLSYCCDTGVGLAGFDFYRHLPFARWIVVPHRHFGIMAKRLDRNCHVLPQEVTVRHLEESLSGITTVFCIERGYYPGFFRMATRIGVATILMPNAEWFDPKDPDMSAVDAFIAPTIACYDMLRREGFGERVQYIPHPVDTERFRYQPRERAERFVHCHGWGGYKERKGTDLILKAAAIAPEIDFLIRRQRFLNNLPPNCTAFEGTAEPQDQYTLGDVCIQPSRWEGVGLQILEAMSSGLPTIVPDAPPMNEYQSEASLLLPAQGTPVVIGSKEWVQWEIDPQVLAMAVRQLHNQAIGILSLKARKAMEARSWLALQDAFKNALRMTSLTL